MSDNLDLSSVFNSPLVAPPNERRYEMIISLKWLSLKLLFLMYSVFSSSLSAVFATYSDRNNFG